MIYWGVDDVHRDRILARLAISKESREYVVRKIIVRRPSPLESRVYIGYRCRCSDTTYLRVAISPRITTPRPIGVAINPDRRARFSPHVPPPRFARERRERSLAKR